MIGFNEEAYLEANQDVADCVQQGSFKSGWDHFISHGIKENRRGLPDELLKFLKKSETKTVDIAINTYGKPYQTALTLLSLSRYCSQHINKIYVTHELAQPIIFKLLKSLNVIYYKPKYHIKYESIPKDITTIKKDRDYRWSIRYQYAWENSDKNYLFITHNDCLYTDDIIGNMLDKIENNAGVGLIGQCWNCPVKMAELCNSNKFSTYNPTYKEIVDIIHKHKSPRTNINNIDKIQPMPLPECRLNEFAALINIGAVRKHVVPIGDIHPIGISSPDVGVLWFRELVLMGYKFHNFDTIKYHAILSKILFGIQNGYTSTNKYIIDNEMYSKLEQFAKAYLENYYD